jgi:hypothetical protein
MASENASLQRAVNDDVEPPMKSEKLPKRVTESDLRAICKSLRPYYKTKVNGHGCEEGELVWHIPLV